VPYRRDPLKRDVAPTMNDPVNVIMTQSVCHREHRVFFFTKINEMETV